MHRRHKITRPATAHLMFLHHDLRKPICIEYARNDACILLRQRNKIAVIVVSHIFMVHARHRTSFVSGSTIFKIVLHHHIHAIRIVAGHDHQHHIIQPGLNGLILRGEQFVSNQRRSLRGTDFAGVHGHSQQDEHLSLCDQFLRIIVR